MNKDLLDDRYGRFWEIPLALAGLGHNVTGLCLSYINKPEGWQTDEQINWISINAGKFRFVGLVRFIKKAFKHAKKCDAVWACSDSFYGIIACFIGKLINRPVVFDIYDNFDEFAAGKIPIVRQLYHWAIRKSDAVTCLSNAFKEYLLDNYAASQYIVPIEFAIDKNLFKPLDRNNCRKTLNLPLDKRIIGAAGALLKVRDVPLLIESFKKVQKKYPDTVLALAGPRDFEIGQDIAIIDMGILPYYQVPAFINSLDIAVICYADDNYGKYCFPQRTREYIGCKVPIVAADVGALKEVFSDEPEWRYSPGSVDSLTQALENRILDSRTSYKSLPDWRDLALILEEVMNQVILSNPTENL